MNYYSVHSGVCDCGIITNQVYVVIASSSSLLGYKTCIKCGGLAQIGFDFNNPLTTGYRYISNIGVVVLTELDINSYLFGTLEFHKEIFNVQYI